MCDSNINPALKKSWTRHIKLQHILLTLITFTTFNTYAATTFNHQTCNNLLEGEANKVCHEALKGDTAAGYAMSRLFADPKNGPLVNLDYAYFWHIKLARQVLKENLTDSAYIDILYNTGVLYNDGLGTEKNLKKAFYWFSQAAEKGHALAMLQVALAYENGITVPKDIKQGLVWLKKAVDLQNPDAQIVMAQKYMLGKDIEENQAKAIELLKAAAEHNSAKANFILGNFYLANSNNAELVNIDQAKNYYGNSCKLNFLLGCKRYYDLTNPVKTSLNTNH